MTCKGRCTSLLSPKMKRGEKVFDGKRKMCMECKVRINFDGYRCPCCNILLRTRPRQNRNRHTWKKHRNLVYY